MRLNYICDMMQLHFSFIIPVYNRPDEIQELLESFLALETNIDYEIVIVEDGSTVSSKEVVEQYKSQLNISCFFKGNSGPGDSRNYGMQHAQGNYFIILDSDCVLPRHYLTNVVESLKIDYVDCYGGPDAAHDSFTNVQKAINFAMTSFISTGGIRGRKDSINEFQPRSFNMGLSKAAFNASDGFGRIHPGEDPDLSIRLKKLRYRTKLIPEAYVYHKRRISWYKFYKQVQKFGLVRPILNKWHPDSMKLTYWFPTLFCLGLVFSGILFMFNINWPIISYGLYFVLAFIISLFSTKNLIVASLSMFAIGIQFIGYGYGFLKSNMALHIFNREPEKQFPDLFFKSK